MPRKEASASYKAFKAQLGRSPLSPQSGRDLEIYTAAAIAFDKATEREVMRSEDAVRRQWFLYGWNAAQSHAAKSNGPEKRRRLIDAAKGE